MHVNWWKTTRRSPRISGTVKFSSLITTTANKTVHPFETKPQLSHIIDSTLERFPLVYVDGWSPSTFTRSDQLFMTLINLKLNSLFLDLAERFCTSKATVHIIITNIFALHEVFLRGWLKTIYHLSLNARRQCHQALEISTAVVFWLMLQKWQKMSLDRIWQLNHRLTAHKKQTHC